MKSLTRAIQRAGLGYSVLWQTGPLPAVPDDHLKKYLDGQKQYKPQLPLLRLDLSGNTTQDLASSKWNQAVRLELARAARKIVSRFQAIGDSRFGMATIDLKKLYKTRFQKLLMEIHVFRPKPGETEEQRRTRLGKRIVDRRIASKRVGIRHTVSRSNLYRVPIILFNFWPLIEVSGSNQDCCSYDNSLSTSRGPGRG